MTDHGDEDDPRLQSLRAVWLSLPDEEPPQRGLADLMAAARVKAEEMASPKPSLWQRITAMLRRPPVLALASVMVLVGGAVLVTQRREKLEAPQLALETAAEAPAAPSAPPPPEPLVHDMPAAASTPEPEAAVAPPVRRRPRPQVQEREEAATTDRTVEADDAKTAPAIRDDSSKGTTALSIDAPVVGGAEGTSQRTADADAAPTRAPVSTTNRAPSVMQYLQQAKTAAARGDCAAARANLDRVKRADATAYRRAIDTDAALKNCVR